MGISLNEIAKELKNNDKKVQLIYAFNGIGKTRLSREFRSLVIPQINEDDHQDKLEVTDKTFLYYNAFTEDLFYWDNDLENNENHKIIIQPNSFTKWILEAQGKGDGIIEKFWQYSSSVLTPKFSADFNEIIFSLERGNDEILSNIKISKGEESNFIWSLFFVFLEVFLEELDEETDGDTEKRYVFIDDPVTSLDDNHLIQLAVDLSQLIKKSNKLNVEFVVTTHNPLFYNVVSNELGRNDKTIGYKNKKFQKYRLNIFEDKTFLLKEQDNDSPFSYHLFLKNEIKKAIETGDLKRYHFNFLRNILEKTATFLGYRNSVDLFPKVNGDPDPFVNRIINVSSHSKHSGAEIAELPEDEKEKLKEIFNHLISNYKFGEGDEDEE